MRLTVREIEHSEEAAYTTFISQKNNKAHATFFHTVEWGEFMRSGTIDFKRIGIYDGAVLIAAGQAVRKKLRFGSFWYMPRGLVMDYNDMALIAGAYAALKNYFARVGNAGFLRVDPDIVRGDVAESAIDVLLPKKSYIFTQAERVWLVDLQKDEPSLLEWLKQHGMRKKLPYYLRRAAKEGVTVRVSSSEEDMEIFLELLRKLNVRKGGIGKHQDEYYRRQFAAMAPKGYEKLFVAVKNGEVLAASLVGIYGKEGSYLHAASGETHRDLSAPHLLQYEVMKYLQVYHPEVERYNFWGIVSDKNRNTNHPRNGYSEFKRSFGGYKVEFIRSRDFVYKRAVWQLAWVVDWYRTKRYNND